MHGIDRSNAKEDAVGIRRHQSPAERHEVRQQQHRERGADREQPFQKLEVPERQLYASEPDSTRRASREELGAISEAANVDEDEDPAQQVLPHVTEEGDLTPPRTTVSAARSGVPREPDTVEADELGAHYLKGAVQDPRPDEPEARTPAEEALSLSAGEERLLERLVRAFGTEGGMITQLPNLSEIERNLSELSLEAVRYARAAGARTHEEVRRKAGEYLEQRAEQLGLGPRKETGVGDDTVAED